MVLEPVNISLAKRGREKETVKGYVCAAAPGLALTRVNFAQLEFWQITHAPTGNTLQIQSFSLPLITRYLILVAALCDWSAHESAESIPMWVQKRTYMLKAACEAEDEADEAFDEMLSEVEAAA